MRRSNGFTLIEVLAALIIVGLGMLAVIRAVNQTVNNTSYLREKAIAHWVAMNKLTETRLSMSAPANDSSDGDVDMAGMSWRWRMTVNQLGPGIQQIEVKVAHKEAPTDSSMDTVIGLYGSSFAPGNPANWDYTAGGINPNPGGATPSVTNGGNTSAPSKPSVGPLN
jgi:general secretion pathway protein I